MIYYEDFIRLIELADRSASTFKMNMANIECLISRALELDDTHRSQLHALILEKRAARALSN